jgi:photosystem II stability/assembly factor-like uncharacterized protein
MVLALWAATAAGACRGSGGQQGPDGAVDAATAVGWSVQKLPATAQVLALRGVGGDLYVAGYSGMVLRTGDDARTWVDVSIPAASTGATIAMYPVFDSIGASAADDVWVAGAAAPESGVLMHTTDRGQSWQQIDVGMAGPFDGVWSIDRDHVIAATGTGQILATADGGASWTTTFSNPQMMLWGAWGSASGDLYVVGGVVITGDGGVGADASDGGGAPDGGAAIFPVYGGVVLHSSDGGMTWQNVANAATPCILWRVSGTADGATVYAVGGCGSVASTTDHGATWSRSGAASAGENYAINDVWVSPTGTSYLLAAGRGFSGPSLGDYQVCRAVDVGDNGALVTVSTGCELLPPNDGGFSSSPMAIWGTADDDVWTVGSYTPLWHRS